MSRRYPRLGVLDQARVPTLLRARAERLTNDPSLLSPAARNLGREAARDALRTLPATP